MLSPATQAALDRACSIFANFGRAQRVALVVAEERGDICDFALRTLVERLLMYAWATREMKADVPYYRERARATLRAYRTLQERRQ